MRLLFVACLATIALSSCTAAVDVTADTPSPATQAALVDLDGNPFLSCGPDDICNAAVCDDDPDCPPIPESTDTCQRAGGQTWVWRQTPCGGRIKVRQGDDDPLRRARDHIERKWPNFDRAKSLDYDDNDNNNNDGGESCWREGHGEANLAGFGVSLTRAWPSSGGGCGNIAWEDVHANEDPNQPSLLFFEKTTSGKNTWRVIGAGYHYHYDPCEVPCLTGATRGKFMIHEAGWHRVPGDGGFDCVKQRFIDSPGIDITDQCEHIEAEDFSRNQPNLAFGANKHGRVWTYHMFFEPGTNAVAVAASDPWCRDTDAGSPNVVNVDCTETDAFQFLVDTCQCG
jgi:hypothetical protein